MKQQKLLKTAILLSLWLCSWSAFAQNSYSFKEATDTYTELSDATVIKSSDFSSGFYMLPVENETYKFYNIRFKFGGILTFAVQPNGNLRIDNDSSLIIIDGAFTYLDSIDNTSQISYKIEGQSGNQIVKVQWKNFKIRDGGANNFVNFQIWVYQKSGLIENRYGSSSPSNQIGFPPTTGPQVGVFYSPDDFSGIYEKQWINGHHTAPTLDTSKNYVFRAMQGVPPEGVVYSFVPRFSTLSTPETVKEEFAFYPNPTSEKISFSKAVSGKIINAIGKEVLTFSETTLLNVQMLHTGIYMIRLTNGATQKLIKQ
jgi:hypothetical protein